MAAQTLSSTSESRWNHDVFLSFRGEDTRKAFTDHLYTALVHAGIHTFRDDEKLPRGNHISTELLKAIQGSRVSIVVFSKGYASSCWCLDELVEIIRCKNFIGQTLIPIFYNVDPSDVRKQTGTFAEAFSRHEQRFQAEIDRVHKWRAALTEAADYSGWDLQNISNGYESKFIEKIVEEILSKESQACLHVAIHHVGIHSRVEKMKALLNLGTSDVRIVGMYGMGGIGKTTIAKAVYNDICHEFEGSSFLLNIKEISEQPNGLIRLQEQLLSDILKTKNWKISNLDVGINLIMKRFCRKRVLVVLDDVDNLKQLHSFLGNFEFFGPRSRVIATTRDEHVLTKLGVHEKYKVEEMNLEESLQLFSWHAFKKAHPREDYLKLSLGVVAYVGGLPLAVEVLGSYLLGRSITQWKSALEKLQKIPHKEIQKILRISFDSLEDDYLRDIFLDIACFFIGTNKEYASKVFDGCDFNPNIGITILIERSLLTINEINELRMHDLIRDMGREIVREMSPKDPGQRSRLWFRKDVLDVLINNHLGSEAIEGLILNLPVLEDVRLKIEAFAKMKKLRLLQIDGRYLTGCYEHLSKELRWLNWHKCPLKFLPPNFSLENLVILDMQHSNVKQVWKEIKILNKLKVLNLKGSKCLTQSPNFLRVPHLEILILEGCTSLVEVHDSIGHLKSLALLNLRACKNLKNLPEIISNLESLETLNLSHCIKIDKLPKQLGNMVALRELLADGTAIKQLPYSFGLLKKLKFVSLSGCKGQSSKSLMSGFLSWLSQKCTKPIKLLPTSVYGLCSLRELNLSDCNLFEDEIPNDLGSLPSLELLWLARNNFRSLPPCIGRLPKLYVLLLHECTSLKSISELPASLLYLDTHDCSSFQRLPNLVPNQERLDTWFCMESCIDSLAFDFRKTFLQDLSKCGGLPYIVLPGGEVPNWFSHKRIGSSISFHIPSEVPKGQIMGLLVSVVYARREDTKFSRRSALAGDTLSININNRPFEMFNRYTRARHYDKSYLFYFANSFFKAEIENGNEITIDWKIERYAEVKKCGVHLVVDEPNALGEYVDYDTCGDCTMDMVSAKRGRDDNEAGPSNDWSSHENCPKRSRIFDSEA